MIGAVVAFAGAALIVLEDADGLPIPLRQLRWQVIDPRTVAEQQETADFYQAHGLMNQRLDVAPTFATGFTVPTNAKLAAQP